MVFGDWTGQVFSADGGIVRHLPSYADAHGADERQLKREREPTWHLM
jgi:hypothetical protein